MTKPSWDEHTGPGKFRFLKTFFKTFNFYKVVVAPVLFCAVVHHQLLSPVDGQEEVVVLEQRLFRDLDHHGSVASKPDKGVSWNESSFWLFQDDL